MSPALNLLDWRSLRRMQEQQRLRRQLQRGLLAALFLLLLVYGGLQLLIEQQGQQQALLHKQLRQQEQQLQAHYRHAEQARRWRLQLQQIEALRRQRELPGLWLEVLEQSLPPTLRWSELQQTADGLLLKGQAQDAAQLGDYLQALQQSAVFAQVQLQAQQSEAQGGLQRFVLFLQPAPLAAGS